MSILRKLPKYLYHGGNADINLSMNPLYRNYETNPQYGFGLYTTTSRKMAKLYLDNWEMVEVLNMNPSRSPSSGLTTFSLNPNSRIADWESEYVTADKNEYETFSKFFDTVSDKFKKKYRQFGMWDSTLDDLGALAASKYMRVNEKLDGWRGHATPVSGSRPELYVRGSKEFNIVNPAVLTKKRVSEVEEYEWFPKITRRREIRNRLNRYKERSRRK